MWYSILQNSCVCMVIFLQKVRHKKRNWYLFYSATVLFIVFYQLKSTQYQMLHIKLLACDVSWDTYIGNGYCDDFRKEGYNSKRWSSRFSFNIFITRIIYSLLSISLQCTFFSCNWDGGDCCDETCVEGFNLLTPSNWLSLITPCCTVISYL